MTASDGRKLALLVACSKYEDSRLADLRSPVHDIEGLAGVLADPAIGGFEVSTVTDEPSSRVQEEIEDFFTDRNLADLLLLYFSCHGVKSQDGRLYMAAANTRLDRLRTTTVPSQFVKEQMDLCRSRRILLILDCCYSGAFASGMPVRAGSEIDVAERFKGTGRAVITASSAMEYAFEGEEPSGTGIPSVFTGVLVDGLRTGEADRDGDGWVSVNELYDHIYEQVREKNPNQTPRHWLFDGVGQLYIARSRKTPEPPPARPLVLVVMGVKGGVGKGTVTLCIAHLIAEAGRDVAVIDFDLNNAGTTLSMRKRFTTSVNEATKTVYDHLAPYAVGVDRRVAVTHPQLWDVTPRRLRHGKQGRIWFLPAVRPGDDYDAFRVVANIPEPRGESLGPVIDELVERAVSEHSVSCVLIDCGAEDNPIYSAAFSRADRVYVVAIPDAIYLPNVNRIMAQHQRRHPDDPAKGVAVIVNMVTPSTEPQARAYGYRVSGFINRDPVLEEDQNRGGVAFDIDYEEFRFQVRRALALSDDQLDRAGLTPQSPAGAPENIALRDRSWWSLFVVSGLAREELDRSRRMIRRALLGLIVAVLPILGLIGLWADVPPAGWNFKRVAPLLAAAGVLLLGCLYWFAWRSQQVWFLHKLAGLEPGDPEAGRERLLKLLTESERRWRPGPFFGLRHWKDVLLNHAFQEAKLSAWRGM